MSSSRLEGSSYPLLRHLTLPVVAVTTSANGRRNGFIVNSAQRASLVPSLARISLYVSKTNFSHDLVYASGVFGIHLLRDDQFDVIRKLGLRSARDVADKLEGIPLRDGMTGCPMLEDCVAAFECRVINTMDTGSSTFFLGDVVETYAGDVDTPVMTSTRFREHAPDDMKREYEARLVIAQSLLESISHTIDPTPWPGVTANP